MNTRISLTQGNIPIRVEESTLPLTTALNLIYRNIDSRRGALFSSGFEYPGRHSRWDIGFLDPALELQAFREKISFKAFNPQGELLLVLIAQALQTHPHIRDLHQDKKGLKLKLKEASPNIPEEDRTHEPSLFTVLRALTSFFHCPEATHFGLYGVFGYDLVQQFEKIKEKHSRSPEQLDCRLFLPLELCIVDRKREVATSIKYSLETPNAWTSDVPGGGEKISLPQGQGTEEIISDHQPGEFASNVQKVIDGTLRGDYFEVVLSQSLETRCDKTPLELLHLLEQINPSPYLFLFNFGDEQLVGSSPEIFVRVTGKTYETCPIAGTVKRGNTALEDADNVRKLICSRKEESELTMCTDVDRNDMARVCIPGTVKVVGRRQLEFYSHLIHTVDHVCGILADKYDGLDAFQTHMWACTVTGAPKPAALQEIENLEKSPRGWYSGAVGFVLFNGNINTGITLRTAQLKNGRATLRSGATLLHGSNPHDEEKETRTKAAAFLEAITSPSPDKKPAKNHKLIKPPLPFKLPPPRDILLIDYRDSFVHNLASYLRELGSSVTTYRDGLSLEIIERLKPDLVFLSPGPGTPGDYSMHEVIAHSIKLKIPLFGVCLGHQGIAEYFGGKLGQFATPEHGKECTVRFEEDSLFAGVPQQFSAGRYHSLYVEKDSLPTSLKVIAKAKKDDQDIIMALRHETLPISSVQFHPESLMSLKDFVGHHILANLIASL